MLHHRSMRWMGLGCLVVLVACGKTAKHGAEPSLDAAAGQAATGGAPAEVAAPNCAVSIASDAGVGRTRHCAAYEDGSVWCWGVVATDDNGPTPSSAPIRVSGISGASKVFMAEGTSCALAAGSLWCWGDNSGGKLTDSGRFLEEPTRVAIGEGPAIRDVGIGR